MPTVFLKYKSGVELSLVLNIRNGLPKLIARALHVVGVDPATHLVAPNDVSVEISQFGEHDISPYDIAITVLANEFPERKGCLPSLNQTIADCVQLQLTKGWEGRMCVWTLLAPAAFNKFTALK